MKTNEREEPVQSGARSRVLQDEMDFQNLENKSFKYQDLDYKKSSYTIVNEPRMKNLELYDYGIM